MLAFTSPKVGLDKYYDLASIEEVKTKFTEEFDKYVDFEINHLNTFYLTDSLTDE